MKKVRTGGEWLDYIVQDFLHLNKSRGKNVIYLFFICLFCLSPSCPTLSGLCSPVVGLFMCSWEEVIYVSAADLWQFLSASQFMQQWAKHHCFISFSEYTLSPSLSLWRSSKTKMGACPSSASSTQSVECQQAYPDSCKVENALCLYPGMYCFYMATAHWMWLFNTECTSGFWAV